MERRRNLYFPILTCSYGVLADFVPVKKSCPRVCLSVHGLSQCLASLVDTAVPVPFRGHTRPVTGMEAFTRCSPLLYHLDSFKVACFPLAALTATLQRAFLANPDCPPVSFAGLDRRYFEYLFVCIIPPVEVLRPLVSLFPLLTLVSMPFSAPSCFDTFYWNGSKFVVGLSAKHQEDKRAESAM